MGSTPLTVKHTSLKQEYKAPLSETLAWKPMQANNIFIMRSDDIQHQRKTTTVTWKSLYFCYLISSLVTSSWVRTCIITAVCVQQIPPIFLKREKWVSFNFPTGYESLFLPCPWHCLHLTSFSGMYEKKRKRKTKRISPLSSSPRFMHRSC